MQKCSRIDITEMGLSQSSLPISNCANQIDSWPGRPIWKTNALPGGKTGSFNSRKAEKKGIPTLAQVFVLRDKHKLIAICFFIALLPSNCGSSFSILWESSDECLQTLLIFLKAGTVREEQ